MHRFLLAVVGALITTVASANDPFPPVFGGSVLGESGRVEGNVFSVFPLNDLIGWGPSHVDSVLFVEPMIGWQEGGATSASLGLGFRQLFGDPTRGHSKLAHDIDLFGEGWYLGGNVFADWLQSERGLDHWQLSSGIEIGSRYVSLHANYYWPLSQEKRFGQRTETLHLRSAKEYELYVSAPFPAPGGAGRGEIHDIFFKTYKHDWFREFTIGQYAEALRGWDADISLLVPRIDKYVDLRLIAGLYGYRDGNTARGFDGWRVGVEFRPIPPVVLMATHFSDDRFDDGQWMAGVRFEIPLGTGVKDLMKPRRRTLPERLTEPVARQNAPTVAIGQRVDAVKSFEMRKQMQRQQIFIDTVPQPGDAIRLEDGTTLIVERNGTSLRAAKPSDRFVDGFRWNGETWVWTGRYDSQGFPVFRSLERGEHLLIINFKTGYVAIVPEPSRALLLLLGLTWGLFRRQRLRG